MLVITRSSGEAVVLELPDGQEIVVRLLSPDKAQSRQRIGIDAPPEIVIRREELPSWTK